MRLLKRTLSAFLAFVMVFTMLPLQVWASETQQSANDSVNFGSIVADGADDDRALEEVGNDVDTYIFRVDGEEVSKQYVKATEKIYEPEAPAKEGYKFVGWFDEKTDNRFDADLFSNGVPDGRTYYFDAKFEPVYYVFFMDGIGENAAVVYTQEGVPDTPIKTDVTFNAGPDLGVEGWYYDRDLNQKVQSGDTIMDQNITLYPDVKQGRWLRFDSNGGTPVDSVFMLPGAVTVKPTEPTREGFRFQHWEVEEGKEFQFGSELTESVTLKAKWEGLEVDYKVFYWVENADDKDYSLVNAVDKKGIAGEPAMNPGDTLQLPEGYPDKNLANAVYYNAEKTGNEAKKTIAGDGSTIVNVYYDRNVYTIYFLKNNSSLGDYICGQQEHQHNGFCWRWSIFEGWHIGCGRTEHTHTDACLGDNSNAYAADPITAKYGAKIDWPPTPQGHDQWFVKQEGDGNESQANIQTMPFGGAFFYYRPSKSEETSTAYYYIEKLGQKGEYKEKHKDIIPGEGYTITDVDKYDIPGFTFSHVDYKTDFFGRHLYDGAKFYYTRNNYELRLVNTADKEPYKIQYEAPLESYLKDPKKPANVGKEFTFQGWYLDENFTNEFKYDAETKMPADNLTLYAKWDAPKFTVTVHLGMGVDSENPLKIEVPYGGKINPDDLPEIKLPEGVESYSWATYQNGKYLSFDLDTPLYQDVTIYPYWVSNERFSVTYDLGENVPDKVTDSKRYWGDADADIQGLPKGFKHPDGKVFLGWRSDRKGDNNLYQPGDKIQIQNANVTLTAEWGDVAQKTTLTYDPNGGDGSVKTDSNLMNNQDVTLASADDLGFSRNGFEFLGWATDKNATAAQYRAGDTIRVNNNNPTDNTLYAVWEAVTAGYTVEYWFQKADNDGYVYWEDLDTHKTGNIGTQTDAQPLAETPEGFHHNKGKTVNVEITADGNAVAQVYYDRNVHNVVYKITGEYFANANYRTDAGIRFGAKLPAAPENMDRAGYVWSGWSKLPGTMPDRDVVVTGSYSAATNTQYTVKYFFQDVIGDGYSQKLEEYPDATFEGTTHAQTDAQPLAETPEGFHHNKGKTVNVEITADGNAVAQVYYDRNVHNVVYKITGEYFANANYRTDEGIRFGAELPAAPEDMDKAGYVWSGWSERPGTMPDKNVEVTGSYSLQTGLPYTVKYIWNGKILDAVPGTGTLGKQIVPEEKSFEGYSYKGQDANVTITADEDKNVVNVYYYKNVTLKANSDNDRIYNGETQTAKPGYESSEKNAVFEGIVPTGSGKDAKEYPIAFPANTLNTVDKTELYIVTEVENGTLTINKRPIALTSYGDTKTYDGKALTKPEVEIGDVKFVDGHVEKVEATGTQTLVGESVNAIEITWADKTVEGNYKIEKTEGTLTVMAPENLDEYVVKTHEGQNFKVGDTVTFKITVTNIYAVKAMVKLEEMAGMTFGNGQTALEDVLEPGETKTYTATCILTEQDFENGGVRNTVKVTLDPEKDGEPVIPGTDTDEVPLESKPDMSVDKTVLEPKESYRVGDTIRYQITVTNTGNVPLHDLELTDVMNADGKVTFPAGTDLTRETLNVGDSWIVTCSYVVRAADEGKTISNTAKVISRDDDGNPNKDGEDTTPGESVQKRYSLTIHYRNAAGNAVAGSYSARYHVGDSFKIDSPIVAGYYDPQIRSISSGANGMPAQDLEYVVIYTAIPAPVDPDPEGPNPGPNVPDDDDDDDDTPPVPDPEQEQPPQPQDFEIDPDDYTLTEVEDNETPLANLNLEGHTCCILHLLLMLAAMVVLGFDTKSRKKHQARIFELKKMLAMEEDHSDDPEQP